MTIDNEYQRLLPLILRELERQTIAHAHLIRLRIYLYYNIDKLAPKGGIELLWIRLDSIISRTVKEGLVLSAPPPDEEWLYLPAFKQQALTLLPNKRNLYSSWKDNAAGPAGPHCQKLIRQALKEANYAVHPGELKLEWKGETISIDVAAWGPLQVAIEVKNKFSDVYHSPRVTHKISDDMAQITKHFRISRDLGFVPVLAASLVDRTFNSFQAEYKGLHYRMRFQYMRPENAELCKAIKKELRVGNVQAWDSPPSWMTAWFKNLPKYYQRQYGNPQ